MHSASILQSGTAVRASALFTVMALLLGALAACGQKGPLYLPATAASAPAAAASGASQ
ncbi:LPS translocon maturation chaperone LptM [Rivibacter subsaxonicus]|uniref:LPS translocon maturation chaperone LptM n=1 Tax=Rivibacter subsaxonicus TaxID=457575 RepID=UPI00102CC93F|nr:lipoprotein [Rivibacter subsaxonicus]